MKVKVTQEHIDKAIALRNESGLLLACKCPMALAIQDAGFPKAYVGVTGWYRDSRHQLHPMPRSACAFVRMFDQQKPVKPATFVFEDVTA